MMKKNRSSLTLLFVLILSLISSCKSQDLEASSVGQPIEQAQELDVEFSDAVRTATNASELTQSATTVFDWAVVASLWESAISLMSSVPESSPNKLVSQEKIEEYKSYLNYARSNALLGESCNSSTLVFHPTATLSNGKLRVTVETNLPEGTAIGFSLANRSGYAAQARSAVEQGKAISDEFSSLGNPLEGVYRLEIRSHFTSVWQPSENLTALSNFVSPCIQTESEIGDPFQLLILVTELEIGDIAAANQAILDQNKEAVDILEEAKQLLEIGRRNAVELQRDPNSLSCIDDMQERMERAKNLKERASQLPDKYFSLKVATTELISCSSCQAGIVGTSCTQAEQKLKEAEGEID